MQSKSKGVTKHDVYSLLSGLSQNSHSKWPQIHLSNLRTQTDGIKNLLHGIHRTGAGRAQPVKKQIEKSKPSDDFKKLNSHNRFVTLTC